MAEFRRARILIFILCPHCGKLARSLELVEWPIVGNRWTDFDCIYCKTFTSMTAGALEQYLAIEDDRHNI